MRMRIVSTSFLKPPRSEGEGQGNLVPLWGLGRSPNRFLLLSIPYSRSIDKARRRGYNEADRKIPNLVETGDAYERSRRF